MKITKRMTNLEKGSIIYRFTGDIVLTSRFDSYHGWYTYNDLVPNDDGDCIEVDNGGRVTPADLIGDECGSDCIIDESENECSVFEVVVQRVEYGSVYVRAASAEEALRIANDPYMRIEDYVEASRMDDYGTPECGKWQATKNVFSVDDDDVDDIAVEILEDA